MDLLFIIVIWLIVFTLLLSIFSFIYSKRKKNLIKKKIKNIENENKLYAIDELRKIIRKSPQDIQAREKLAELLIDNKSYLLAIKEYLIIIDRFQDINQYDEIKYLNKIGNAYLKLGNFNESKKYFLISKSKDDTNFEANLRLGEIDMLENNFEKAEKYFNLANQIDQNNYELLKSYGICNFRLNKFGEANEKFFRVIKESNPEDLEIIYYLGYSLYNLNKIDDAIKCFIKLRNEPKYASESFFVMGKIHRNQKLYLKAIEDFDNALVSGSIKDAEKLAEIQYLIADCYFKSHDIQKAIAHWNKVNDLMPNYKDVQEKLNNYSQINSNKLLEIYLVGSINQFTKICKLFVKYYISHFSSLKGNIKFLDMNTDNDGSLKVLTEVTSGNFVELVFFLFMRSATTIGDITLRKLYNTIKEQKADKGICITAGVFSESAKEFVESRMLKLIERERLIEIFEKLGQILKETGE